jgi:uncharacterized tellurite resistance protein B-like protein
MFDALKNWLRDEGQTAGPAADDESARLVADLLVEAAAADGQIDAGETSLVTRLLAERFDLDNAAAARLLDQALEDQENRIEMHRLTSAVREAFDYEERVELLSLIWAVVLADEELAPLEAQLMRRLAGLLFVSDVESAQARQLANERQIEERRFRDEPAD